MTKIRSWNKISKKYQIKLCNNNLENAEILIENDLMEYKNRYFFESVKIIASNINISHKKNNRYQMVSAIFGARDGTWTRTSRPTRPSNVRVCRFRHSRSTVDIITERYTYVNTYFAKIWNYLISFQKFFTLFIIRHKLTDKIIKILTVIMMPDMCKFVNNYVINCFFGI